MNYKEADEILRSGPGDGYPVGLAKNRQTGRSFICRSSSDDGGICVSEFEDTPEFWEKVAADAEEIESRDEYTDRHEALSQAIENLSTHVVSTAFWG